MSILEDDTEVNNNFDDRPGMILMTGQIYNNFDDRPDLWFYPGQSGVTVVFKRTSMSAAKSV